MVVRRASHFVCFLLSAIHLSTVTPRNVGSLPDALEYLKQFGYVDPNPDPTESKPNVVESSKKKDVHDYIMNFQSFVGLPKTGELDSNTVTMMNMPRCGVKDIQTRFSLQGSKWKKKNLTYRISIYPSFSQMSNEDVDYEIAQAFKVWSDVSELTFEAKKEGEVDIDIKFAEGEHGDGNAFDGSGGTLAHAFFPYFGGDAHFDDGETWTMNTNRGTNLRQTAVHEFGHSLGLQHSDQGKALMYPFYRGFQRQISLDKDDIDAITTLYGKKKEHEKSTTTTTTTTTTKPKPNMIDSNPIVFPDNDIYTKPKPGIQFPERNPDGGNTFPERNPVIEKTFPERNPDKGNTFPERTPDKANTFPERNPELCIKRGQSFDAIVTTADQQKFGFKNDKYWKFTDEDSIAPGYPRSITDWKGLPRNLDAAFTWTNGKTYFFKKSMYWRFSNQKMDNGYPKRIDSKFTGIPDNIDAAFVWSRNSKIYFFKGSKYWEFDMEGNIASPEKNWKLNEKTFGDSAHSRDTSSWWFGCSAKSHSFDIF